jgi:hypothetical protein
MLDIPTHILYYEDYATSFNRTVSDLSNFLQLPTVKKPLHFQAGKTYEYLYTPSEMKIAARLIRGWASVDCWVYVRNYVAHWLSSQDEIHPGSIVDTVTVSAKRAADPKIVWLMSFPNSGTSYTITSVMEFSNSTTATNYADEAEMYSSHLVAVRADLPLGPFVLCPEYDLPEYVLTKTHCTAYCDSCRATDSIKSVDDFLLGCQYTTQGQMPHLARMGQAGYLPSKAVHIFRNVFDNIVARKHLGVRSRVISGQFKDPDFFADTRDGMLAWCRHADRGFQLVGQDKKLYEIFNAETRKMFEEVPCYSEFFR